MRQGFSKDREGVGSWVWTCERAPTVHQFMESMEGAGIRTKRGRLLTEGEVRTLLADSCPACSRRTPIQERGPVTASLLHNIDVLRPLGPKLQARVASIARLAALPEGTVLARQGERGDRFYGILTGEVQLTTESSRGEITVRVAGPGESVPLAVLIGDGDLITTATAMSPLRAIEIPRLPFDRLCREQPEIGRRVYATVADILADRYRRTLGRLIDTLDAAAAAPEFSANL